MKRLVMDASVALKWFLADEEHGEKALDLLDRYVSNRLTILAPALLEYEVVNGLIIAKRRGRIEEKEIIKALEGFSDLKIDMRPIAPNYAEVLRKATGHKITAYDACYLALAEAEEAPLVTADRKLFNSARKSRWIRWLEGI